MTFYLSIAMLICSFLLPLTGFAAESSAEVYEADYVVVGMGAAGAEIANILSERGHSVIGIEAGANHDNDTLIKDSVFAPVLEPDFFPQYFYQLSQVVQPNAPDTDFNYTTGRLLGGGTSINGEQYVEGTDEFYAQWQALLGDFWSVHKIRKAFIAIENYNGVTNSSHRGNQGNLDIRQAPVIASSMAKKFVRAVTAATGFAEIFDYNNPETELGPFTRWQLTQQPNGNRESSSTAFLTHISGRNLRILTKSTALRILLEGKRATGVAILKDGFPGKVFARKKVIISAGVYSPWLLQVSGIGPRNVLEKAGVNVIEDNANVGQNLVNQLITSALFTANPDDVGVPLSDPNALYVGGAFLPDPSRPVNPISQGLRGIQLIGGSPASDRFSIAIIALQPQSTGSVKIQSGDPLQIPLVDDGAFTNAADLKTFKDAFRVYIKAIAQQLHDIDPKYNLISPTMAVIDNDAALEEYILKNLGHTHHWTGTCRMGNSPEEAVLDKYGNVLGMVDLVVADDSSAPFIPDGNTQACAYLIGRIIAKHIIKS